MRNGLITLVMALTSASGAFAQDWAEKMFVKDDVPQLTHDFGTVVRGAILHHAFHVTNIYAVPIEITAVRPAS